MQDRLPSLRRDDICRVLEAVARNGPLSVADIARQAGLAPAAARETLAAMRNHGWIRESGRTASGVNRGRPDHVLVPEAAAIAVVDLGGTNVRAAISDLAGHFPSQVRESTDHRGGIHAVRQVARLCRRAAEHAGIPFRRVRVAAVGVPGVPERATGRVRMAPNIHGLDAFDVPAALQESLGIDAILENDVNVALLGERWAGGSQAIDDLVYVKVGTGIGAGVLCNGALVRGCKGAGGQISAMPIGADPEEAESLRAGALERVTAGAGIRARYRALSGRTAEVAAIFDRAADGDAAAARALDEASGHLARALAATCAMIDPEKIILGGSIGCRAEIIDRVTATLARIHPAPAPVAAETPDFESALLGCAFLGIQHLAASLLQQDRTVPGVSESG